MMVKRNMHKIVNEAFVFSFVDMLDMSWAVFTEYWEEMAEEYVSEIKLPQFLPIYDKFVRLGLS